MKLYTILFNTKYTFTFFKSSYANYSTFPITQVWATLVSWKYRMLIEIKWHLVDINENKFDGIKSDGFLNKQIVNMLKKKKKKQEYGWAKPQGISFLQPQVSENKLAWLPHHSVDRRIPPAEPSSGDDFQTHSPARRTQWPLIVAITVASYNRI